MCILCGLCRRTALMVFRYFSYALRRDYIDERVLTVFIGREARRLHKQCSSHLGRRSLRLSHERTSSLCFFFVSLGVQRCGL